MALSYTVNILEAFLKETKSSCWNSSCLTVLHSSGFDHDELLLILKVYWDLMGIFLMVTLGVVFFFVLIGIFGCVCCGFLNCFLFDSMCWLTNPLKQIKLSLFCLTHTNYFLLIHEALCSFNTYTCCYFSASTRCCMV